MAVERFAPLLFRAAPSWQQYLPDLVLRGASLAASCLAVDLPYLLPSRLKGVRVIHDKEVASGCSLFTARRACEAAGARGGFLPDTPWSQKWRVSCIEDAQGRAFSPFPPLLPLLHLLLLPLPFLLLILLAFLLHVFRPTLLPSVPDLAHLPLLVPISHAKEHCRKASLGLWGWVLGLKHSVLAVHLRDSSHWRENSSTSRTDVLYLDKNADIGVGWRQSLFLPHT